MRSNFDSFDLEEYNEKKKDVLATLAEATKLIALGKMFTAKEELSTLSKDIDELYSMQSNVAQRHW